MEADGLARDSFNQIAILPWRMFKKKKKETVSSTEGEYNDQKVYVRAGECSRKAHRVQEDRSAERCPHLLSHHLGA